VAEASGARLVHSCGFDSIPYDLGTLFTVDHLPEGEPLAVNCYVRIGAKFSGGTYHSAVHAMARLRHAARNASERKRLEPRPDGRRVRGIAGRPRHSTEAGGWIVPVPTIDPQTVLRSARALDRYGPDFSYGHYAVFKRAISVAALVGGAGAGIALAQLPPTRNLMLRVKDPGEGPSEAERAGAWFNVKLVGEGGGHRVVTEVSGGDPGYSETSKMLAESALCLAHDDLPSTAGQVTPAVAMGQALIDRLVAAGINFRVVEES
ncbi:MAG TPA: saccharopine dehydrogenase, partial [Solirubrobacteraceae bacterium]|nr:saccharopine dehydrogenase [Solirubrobacteraceae bacterium]